MQLGFDLGDVEIKKEDAEQVLEELCVNCTSCRLYQIHPANRGMIFRGNLNARIAVVGIAPGDTETEKGAAMVGPSGKLFEEWMKYVGVSTRRDVFITNIVQCQPPKKKISGMTKQRDPEKDEINACFGPRCLRLLRAMPSLEVIMTLGWLPASVLLGTDKDRNVPRSKTHEGQWFESSIMPGIPIFCLSHPAELLRKNQYGKEEASVDRKMVIQHCLDNFRREYLLHNKVSALAKEAQAKREALNIGVF